MMNVNTPPALELAAISKTFPGQRALSDVSLDVAPGEIHALLGHNGSGKSTLIKVVSGFHQPDDPNHARYFVSGEQVRFGDPVAVSRVGVRFIHQDIGLVEELTVLENLRLGVDTYRAPILGRIRWGREKRLARQRLKDLGLDHINPDTPISRLNAVTRTEVAIARAMDEPDAIRVLVLDEASAALPEDEVGHLFALVRTLASRGVGVVYVTHRLEEVIQLAERVTVLRDGKVVLRELVSNTSRSGLARVIAGDEFHSPSAVDRVPYDPTREEVLVFNNVVAGHEINGISFAVHAGEILGVAGLDGSGVHELIRLLQGEVELRGGQVSVGGVVILRPDVRVLREHRVAVLPGERRRKGIAGMNVRENLTIADLTPFWARGWFSRRRELDEATTLVARYGIRPRDTGRSIELLSGGNAQKVYVARLMRTAPRVLVMEEPTHGVDVGGTVEILRLIQEAARNTGTAVLLCSSDTDDLADSCDRVLVLRHGRVEEQLIDKEISHERIVELCYSGS